MVQKVLRIKFKTPLLKSTDKKKKTPSENFHLALRLNDHLEISKEALLQLIKYVSKVFDTRYLTVIAGKSGFKKKSIEIFSLETNTANDGIDQVAPLRISFYHNYDLIFTSANRTDSEKVDILVNLVDNEESLDSEILFLFKLRGSLRSHYAIKNTVASDIYEAAVKDFSNFPSINLYISMTRSLDFTQLFPLQLGFTHFYCCPVLATQLFSKEAITEGFECFDRTKQNYGK